MDNIVVQSIIVGIIIAVAVLFAVRSMLRKRHAFSAKAGCAHDCGCNGSSKKLPS